MQCIQLGADLVQPLQHDCYRVQHDIGGKEYCTSVSTIQGHQCNHVFGCNYVEIGNRKSSCVFWSHKLQETSECAYIPSFCQFDSARKVLKYSKESYQ